MRTVRVPSWMKSSFTASELSGWPTWVDVGASASEREAKQRKQKKLRSREPVEVTPLPVSFVLQ
jgi:hypothetical protein